MIKNYLKIAFRNLWKQKGYTFINIFGLAVGLACCIIILLYVAHELSYDKHHENSDRIYRVISKIDFSGNYLELATAPAPMGPTLRQDFPEVESAARIRPIGSRTVKKGDISLNEQGFVLADSTIFDVFSLGMLYGDAETALTRPETVVITKSIARKYFGREDVVGETMTMMDQFDLEVTGVIEDMPPTSHFHFNFLLSMSSTEEGNNNTWLSNNFRTYLLLEESADAKAFEQNFEIIKKQYVEPQLRSFMGVSMAEFEEAGNSVEYDLQPLTSIHLYSDLTGEFEANGSITYVYIFSGLGIFVLLLACINFMNLATARSSQRAKEIGIRKTLGSLRGQLAIQFLAESLLLSVLALILAMFLVELSLPFFSNLAGTEITSNYLSSPDIVILILGVVLLTGLISGSYPALRLSAFKPVRVLKGVFKEGAGQSFLRKGLVVFQFAISIIIVIGLLVINKQLGFIQNKDLGFQKDQIIIVEDAYNLGSSYAVDDFKEEMLEYPIFKSATISSFFPVAGFGKDGRAFWPGGEESTQNNTVNIQKWGIDEDYIPTMGMEIIKGRNFNEERSQDEKAVILNEAAVKRFKLEDPVGKTVQTIAFNDDGSPKEGEYLEYRVIGVVKDFHFESLRDNITPLGLFNEPSSGNVAFKIAASNSSEAISRLEGWWNDRAPDMPFSYTFLDQQFDQMYRAENSMQDLMMAFSILAMTIACLGLFGLSAYSAERRTKEIGIRKVMGASVPNILGLVSADFMKLIVASFVVAIPISYLLMNQWLQDFVYRTDIGVEVFLWAGAGALLIALLTVSWQSARAAFVNPVESLRSE